MFLDEFDHIIKISIHALREESDITGNVDLNHAYKFQSTPSARRATRIRPRNFRFLAISIHALREEGDAKA